jgi:6-phosphogluconolactonase/glucosamine-6-phosphate isomerase/deaminase
MHYYTNENIGYYSDLLDEVGEGGADLLISATGWIGHTAFIDPDTRAFKADTLEEFNRKHRIAVENLKVLDVEGNDIMRRDLLPDLK